MATPMEEEVQGSSPAAAEAAEGGSPDKPVVDLPAPEGWKKKLIPKRKRDEIFYITPTGEEIKSRTQLDRYLKSHPGGPPSSEFHWGTGTTPRRSSRLTEKVQAESQTPESESKKTPKRSRKSDASSEGTKKGTKRQKSEENEEDKEVDKDESMTEEKLEETRMDDKSGKEEDVKPEEQEMKQEDKVEISKAEDVEMQETVETGEAKAEEGKEAPVEEDKAEMKEPEDYAEEVNVNIEPEVVEEKPSKEPEVEEEKPSKEPEFQSEEKFEKEPEVQLEAKSEKEPEVQVAEYSAVNDHEVNIQEEVKTDVAEEEKSDNKGTYENGVDTEPKVPTHAELQEPLDVKNENGHSGIVLQDHSEQQKSVEPMNEMSDDSKPKYSTLDAPRTEELQSSNSSAPQQPSEQLGTSS